MLTRFSLLVVLSTLLPACGPRMLQPTQDGAVASAEDTHTSQTPPTDCVLASVLSGCCRPFIAATRQEVMADPCLWAPGVPSGDEVCQNRAACDEPCDFLHPPSRVFELRDGQCAFADECAVDSDCVVAYDHDRCCCGYAAAKEVVLADARLSIDEGECEEHCPAPCPLWPTANFEDGTSYGMVARCESVATDDGAIKGCVPRPPTWGYLLWQAPGGFAGWGPALEVTPSGSTRLWRASPALAPHGTENWDVVFRISPALVDELFSLLAAVDYGAIPPASGEGGECYPSFVYQRCPECPPNGIAYNVPADLSPALDAIYAWLDAQIGPKAEGIPMPGQWCLP